MQFDSDVLILGTGLAPLIAAVRLMHEGRRVLVLNPDWDFFSEGSELSLDPGLLQAELFARDEGAAASYVQRNQPSQILETIRPDFPGAIELAGDQVFGFHDLAAPHVRSRQLLWISEVHAAGAARFEEFFISSQLPTKLQPQWLNPANALSRFPGMNPRRAVELSERTDAEWRGLLLPKFGELDLDRYRYSVLEYLREKVGSERVITGVSDLDAIPGGFRFVENGQARTARFTEGVLGFWTPRMKRWMMKLMPERDYRVLAKDVESRTFYLEDWSLVSRDSLDPQVVGLFEDLLVWAEAPPVGVPDRRGNLSRTLRVLRWTGEDATVAREEMTDQSLGSISRLTRDFLGWNRFSVHSLVRRTWTLPPSDPKNEWELQGLRFFPSGNMPVAICSRAGGSLPEVVSAARFAVDQWLRRFSENSSETQSNRKPDEVLS